MLELCSSTSAVFHRLGPNSNVSNLVVDLLEQSCGYPRLCTLICPDTVLLALFLPPAQLLSSLSPLALLTDPHMDHSMAVRAIALIAR